MTGSNWQAEMMNRLDDGSAAAENAAASGTAPAPSVGGEAGAPGLEQYPPPTMPAVPAPTGSGWGAPVPPQEQQPEYVQPQYNQAPYQPPAQNYQPQNYPAPEQQSYQQDGYPPPQQAYPPPQGYQQPPYDPAQQYQQAPQYPQYQQPPVQQYEQPYEQPQYQQPPVPQYEQPPYGQPPQVPPAPYQQQYPQPPTQQAPPQQQPAQWEQPPAGDRGWNAPPQEASSWDNPAPDGGPDAHAYAPAYQDPLAGPLPVATGSVGLQHEDRTGSGGFLRRIGRFAAEAAYIAGASGRMQRDVENIAIIRRPIGIGRMIGVIGPVPLSGTSIVTALLADALASQRTDIVLAVDAFPREGKLTHRLDQGLANTPNSRIQLARSEPTADAISEVLAARNVGGANQIPLSLVDCPAGLFEEATGYVAGAAHSVALVVPSSRDGARASVDLLDQLTTDGQQMLVQKGLVIIAEGQPNDPEPVRWLQSAVSDRGLGYVVLPYDEHLGHAWPLRPEQLEPATRRAVLEFAARLVERATR
ncbi:MinD-like ATPase involved in chromosome partitioning or flagellar assembly [Kribbella orskensis]|uniref:MinD-like ATPase involved in chromosome partitioning or flagellar assembly n=2 Tax=Kribbella TaxID=182639 RepID=A0ABY2BIL0_9ACTN|nr:MULTISPECIES: hypothetical protein [Kribbella]TCN38027.1 MinD-like ATPase involved in chromosome partitioning or flagellar assembly [Kribbella sp. VKM Ac-2500]TCO19514.1 MinD-like ATPase involved in chromosome partitioning or flagellar assembly [Kribbella orskensis]